MQAPAAPASSSTIHLLHRAGQLAEDLFARAIGDLNLTARQYIVLSVVDEVEKPSQATLCQLSGIDRSTMADIVHRLVSRGLLTRRRTREDARMYAVQITAEGKSVLKRAGPRIQNLDALDCLTASECEAFKVLLHTILVHAEGPP
jgi:DNA-binding MarR family transcriptional regulator